MGVMMKLQKIIILLVLSAFYIDAAQEICPTPVSKQYKSLKPGKMVSAYVANWDVYGARAYKIKDIHKIADKLTHIVYAFMKPDEVTGTCRSQDVWGDFGAVDDFQSKVGGNFAQLLELKKQFPHLKILLSIGGGTYNKNFVTLAQDSKKLQKFAKSCVDILDFYDHEFKHFQDKTDQITHFTYDGLFDGLDIDWEWDAHSLTPALSQSFTSFIHELRRLLEIRKKQTKQNGLLTIALQVSPSVYKNLNLVDLAKDINWFHVMAYDFFGPWSDQVGFNAPICSLQSKYSVDGAIQRIMEEGVSPKQMVLGLPLYGYLYENVDGYNGKVMKKNLVKAISYQTIKNKYVNNHDFLKTWDDFSLVSSLYSPQHRIFISYDDIESVSQKVEFAQDKKMLGVILWRLSGDDDYHTIVHTIVDTMM